MFSKSDLPDSKRIMDFTFSATFILCFFWLFLIIGILVRFSSPGPIIHMSKRVGLHGRIYSMPKFRTMTCDAPEVPTDLLKDPSNYITWIGVVLRRSSLDELPQFFSVLVGDMSLVGPRPSLRSQENLTSMRSKLGILSIKPGITGWAQVNGRDMIEESEKIQLDKFYLDNRSTFFDVKIICMTFVHAIYGYRVKH